ncbi:MAG: GFA family protein [Rhodospirillaceae bacterium]|nr:GFA family protein [Rhodospirillaceae bacterium]MBT4427913.1 GFA family protein [Rhodospirillaceae bacterium]MBT6830303.1 GFA family protein [Rhodospirillaceae bacterium]
MNKNQSGHRGGCLCGNVRYEVLGTMRGVVNCHCEMCRRLHGAYGAYTKVSNADFTLAEESGLAWYQSSAAARRGFCRDCGASLFWQPAGFETTSIAAGTLDQPSGLATTGHIYTAEKGDFYDINDSLRNFPGSAEGALDDA